MLALPRDLQPTLLALLLFLHTRFEASGLGPKFAYLRFQDVEIVDALEVLRHLCFEVILRLGAFVHPPVQVGIACVSHRGGLHRRFHLGTHHPIAGRVWIGHQHLLLFPDLSDELLALRLNFLHLCLDLLFLNVQILVFSRKFFVHLCQLLLSLLTDD